MSAEWGNVPLNSVIPFFFDAFDGGTGASITLSGIATSDIEVYKGTSMTQRSSDNGYALLDTDGIDVDGITGIHGFSIDTSDNTDAGFYVAGSFYTVVVSSVTIDAQTVNFIAGRFRLTPAESVAGVQEVDVTHFGGTAGTFSSGRPEVNTTHAAGTAWGSGAITAGVIAADAIGASELAADAVAEIADAVWDEDATGHQTTGTFGQAIGDPVADTNTIFKAVVTDAAGATVGVDIVDIEGKVDDLETRIGTPSDLGGGATVAANLSDIEGQTDDIGAAGAGLTAVPWNSSWDAEVQSEVQDALDAAVSEPGQGSPAANASLAQKISYLYKAWRNRHTQTASEYALYADDATTKDQEAVVSDDGTTFERGEVSTGA